MRHGKSDWGAGASDHERVLTDRGRGAARRVGRFLGERDERPDRILTSSAARARETTDLAVQGGSFTCPVVVESLLYMTAPQAALDLLRAQRGGKRLLVVGHEPTTSELCSALVGGGRLRFRTAALARIDFTIDDWDELCFGRGELRWLIQAKLL